MATLVHPVATTETFWPARRRPVLPPLFLSSRWRPRPRRTIRGRRRALYAKGISPAIVCQRRTGDGQPIVSRRPGGSRRPSRSGSLCCSVFAAGFAACLTAPPEGAARKKSRRRSRNRPQIATVGPRAPRARRLLAHSPDPWAALTASESACKFEREPVGHARHHVAGSGSSRQRVGIARSYGRGAGRPAATRASHPSPASTTCPVGATGWAATMPRALAASASKRGSARISATTSGLSAT